MNFPPDFYLHTVFSDLKDVSTDHPPKKDFFITV